MMASNFATYFSLRPPYLQRTCLNTRLEAITNTVKLRRRRASVSSFSDIGGAHFGFGCSNAIFKPKSCLVRTVLGKACGDGGGDVDSTPQRQSSKSGESGRSSSGFGDSYVALFVRMLGLDNDLLDREQAIVALWKYSLGGKKCIDNIMQFEGCINLIINLLKSESSSACEAAAGLLRTISSISLYRDVVAESGAIEEITALLSQPSLAFEVKEQSFCALWNLSIDEKLGLKIANGDVLPLVVKSLDGEDIVVKEAAGGILANLALTHSNHAIMVEAGVIPKLAEVLKAEREKESKVIRKEARSTLVELSKNEYYRILIIEEGLVPVPLVGAAAFKSLTSALHSWPTLPDAVKIDRNSKAPSSFGESGVLLGSNFDEKNKDIEEANVKAMIRQSRQQFLARVGATEVKDSGPSRTESSMGCQYTVLPWIDGVSRLALILEVDNELALTRGAEAIANASISKHMRTLFKEAGVVKNLVQLLDHRNDAVRFAVIGALDKLSISNSICQSVEAEGVMRPLIDMLKNSDTSENMIEKALNLLARILNLNKEMKSNFYDGPANGSKRTPDASIGLTARNEIPFSKKNTTRKDVLDSDIISRLVEVLKHSSLSLQTKAASILEYIAIIDSDMGTIMSVNNIESGLAAVFQQKILSESESEIESQQPELYALQMEEAGIATSAGSRLLTKLLDSEKFRSNIDLAHFTELLRKILKSNIPFQYKDWIAAALVKLGNINGATSTLETESPITVEVTLYETIPRLIEQLRSSYSPEAQEAAVLELNRIVSEGVLDATRAVASQGGLVPLVKVIEGGNERAVEAALSILYNLSMDDENHIAILAAGAVPALRRIVLSERPQWKRALHLLRALPS